MCITETSACAASTHYGCAYLLTASGCASFPAAVSCVTYKCHGAYLLLSHCLDTATQNNLWSWTFTNYHHLSDADQSRIITDCIFQILSGSVCHCVQRPSNPNLTRWHHWLICTKRITATGLLKIHKSILVHWQVSHTPGQSEGVALTERFWASKDQNHPKSLKQISKGEKWKFWKILKGYLNVTVLPTFVDFQPAAGGQNTFVPAQLFGYWTCLNMFDHYRCFSCLMSWCCVEASERCLDTDLRFTRKELSSALKAL